MQRTTAVIGLLVISLVATARAESAVPPLVTRGDLVADLRPDLEIGATKWMNHATGPASVGDFIPRDGKVITVVVAEGPNEKTPAARLGGSGGVLISQRVTPDAIKGAGSVSVEACLQADTLDGDDTVLAYGPRDRGQQRQFLYGRTKPFSGFYADVASWGLHTPTARQWHYVVWTYDGTERVMSVYVDGWRVASQAVTLDTVTTQMAIGAGNGEAGQALGDRDPMSGLVASIRVMTGVLSGDDAKANCVTALGKLGAPPEAKVAKAAGPSVSRSRGINDAITPVAKDTHRHAEFLGRIKQGPIGVLFIGDSITDAWPKRGEFHWLKYAPYQPADFGVSGDRTEHILWRMEHGELEDISPKLVVLLAGTNNIGQDPPDTPERAAAGVTKLVETVHTKLPVAKVLLLGVFPRGDKGSRARQDTMAINQIIRKLDDGRRTRYLDIGDVFLDAAGEIPPELMPDKLHPTAIGYQRWYTAMQPLLDDMMKE